MNAQSAGKRKPPEPAEVARRAADLPDVLREEGVQPLNPGFSRLQRRAQGRIAGRPA